MKKKEIIAIIGSCLMALILGFTFQSKNNLSEIKVERTKESKNMQKNTVTENEICENDIILQVSASGDWNCKSDTFDELYKNADIIIEANVEDVNTECDDTATVYSNYSINISKVYKGDIQEGSQIVVSDFGGIIPAEEYIKHQDDPKALEIFNEEKTLKGKYVEYSFEGAWRPEKGKKYVWFLEKNIYDGKVYYNPVNDYQGIFEDEFKVLTRYEGNDVGDDYITKLSKESLKKIRRNR